MAQGADESAKLTYRDQGAHTLAYDIFHALVGLFPFHTHRQCQLWQAVQSGKVGSKALLLTARANPAHINRETVERFEQAMLRSVTFAQKLIVCYGLRELHRPILSTRTFWSGYSGSCLQYGARSVVVGVVAEE